MSKQRQTGGDRSVNLQAESIEIRTGLSLEEVKAIALDIFRSNFYELASVAKDLARLRAEEITTKFLQELVARNPSGLNSATDPDMQYAIFTVQREYARTGDAQLGDILVDMLVDRSKEKGRTLLQIVLNESLSVAPKLTSEQLAALSIVFVMNYSHHQGINSLQALHQYLDAYVAPFVDDLTSKRSCYQHLEYAGCASISGSSMLENTIINNYPAMFCKGFLREDLERALSSWDPAWEQGRIKLLMPCLHDKNKLQINATDVETLDSLALELGLNDEQKSYAKSFLVHTHRMTEGEAREYLTRTHPAMEDLFQIWYRSYLGNLTLTSVGIAIGHANVRRVTKSYDADLAIWVN